MHLSRGILLGLITVLFLLIFNAFPGTVEFLYGQLFYPLYQYLRSFISYLIPIPLIYILAIYILGWVVFKWTITPPFKQWKRLNSIRMLFSIIGFIIFFFYILWGFNYLRPTMAERLNIELEEPDSTYITNMYKNTVDSLNAIRERMDYNGEDICTIDLESVNNSDLMSSLSRYLNILGYPSSFKGYIYPLWPRGFLLRWSTAGFFLPFVGEGYIDPALPNIQKPFVRIHEMSHVYGITQEGEANFLAYEVCKGAESDLVRYSAYLAYYPYIAAAARQWSKENYKQNHKALDKRVLKDFNQIYSCLVAYPDILPEVRDLVYNSYLKSQGVEGGIKSYSKILILEYNWHKLMNKYPFYMDMQ